MGQPRSSYEHWKQHSGFAKRFRPNFAAESKFEDVFHQEIRLCIGPFPEVFKVESADSYYIDPKVLVKPKKLSLSLLVK